jgi:hypothetical protein
VYILCVAALDQPPPQQSLPQQSFPSPGFSNQSGTSMLSYMYSSNSSSISDDDGFSSPLHKEIRRLIKQWQTRSRENDDGMDVNELVLNLQSTYGRDTVRFVNFILISPPNCFGWRSKCHLLLLILNTIAYLMMCRDGISWLITEGHLYTTMDEEHVRITE